MSFLDWINNVVQEVLISDMSKKKADKWDDENIVAAAKKDWQIAQSVFEEINDPELIDFAVYNLKAAEKKYTYLLKRLRSPEIETSAQSYSV